jgi:preprotein translocase subunit SecE|tara:strand:+ start:861 stop:1103 length:243 start_codon:yes stop_codon:yes gene_type:complete
LGVRFPPLLPNIKNEESYMNPLKFIQEVKQEAFKVTWPTGKETMQGTLMVVAMAIIASLFFLLVDQILKSLLQIVLNIGL